MEEICFYPLTKMQYGFLLLEFGFGVETPAQYISETKWTMSNTEFIVTVEKRDIDEYELCIRPNNLEEMIKRIAEITDRFE
jgi:hypothetical protein